MADNYQFEATRNIHAWGMNSWKYQDARKHQCPRCHTWITVIPDMPGRPDMLVWKGGRMAALEVKNGTDRFNFKDFDENKRNYAARWCMAEPFCIQYWIWLCLGTDPPHYNAVKYRPRRTWLIPLEIFYEVEAQVGQYQNSLNYFAGKGCKREIQKFKLDAIHLLAHFELKYETGSKLWLLHNRHPFFLLYIDPEPLPMFKDIRDASYR